MHAHIHTKHTCTHKTRTHTMHAHIHTKHTCTHKTRTHTHTHHACTHTHKTYMHTQNTHTHTHTHTKQYMHTYTGVGRSYILCSLKGPTFCSVSSTACVCPAGQPVNSEDFTDRKSHQCRSHKCQVSLLEFCIFIYPLLSLSLSLLPFPLPFRSHTAQDWNWEVSQGLSVVIQFTFTVSLLQGPEPTAHLGSVREGQRCGHVWTVQGNHARVPHRQTWRRGQHGWGHYSVFIHQQMYTRVRTSFSGNQVRTSFSGTAGRPSFLGNTLRTSFSGTSGEDIILRQHGWGHHCQATQVRTAFSGNTGEDIILRQHRWGHHSQATQVRTTFSGNTGEDNILRQHRWGQHSQATQVRTALSGNTGEDIILRQHRWGHHAVCWPIDWSDTESNTSEDMHRHHSVLTLL